MLNSRNLPPVDQRLPAEPLVVTPFERVGKYGGTWRQAVIASHRRDAMMTSGVYEGRNLILFDQSTKNIVPNLAKSYSVSPDGRDFTFTLRRGLKWSNGDPLDTNDVRFWWEDYTANQDLNKDAKLKYTVEIKDDVTFVVHYNDRSPLEVYTFANSLNYDGTEAVFYYPDEYLKKFHIRYNPNADREAKAAGNADWMERFRELLSPLNNPALPVTTPFVLVTQDPAAATLVFERNPYYWKVDTEGNQLPYIDTCQVNVVESPDVAKMRTIAGEVDLQIATIMEDFADFPLFSESARSGNYTVKTTEFIEPNAMNIHLNLTNQDAAKRAIVSQPNFRKALSLALDRQKIINISFSVGPQKSTPRNFAPYPNSAYLDPALANNHINFDIATANRMLDELGLNRKNAAGKRLLPNGQVLSLVIDVPTYSDSWINIGIQIAECWQAVGIDATARAIDPSLWNQRTSSNDYDCCIMTGGGGFAVPSPGEINNYTGYRNRDWPTTFMSGHIIYRSTEGKEGIAPDADIRRLWELGSAALIEPDQAKLKAQLQEIFDIHKKNLYVLGIGTRLPAIYIQKSTIHNVPPLFVDWLYGVGGHGVPSQYFFD
jgi:peptide/nickel transport system substrate-binding protein